MDLGRRQFFVGAAALAAAAHLPFPAEALARDPADILVANLRRDMANVRLFNGDHWRSWSETYYWPKGTEALGVIEQVTRRAVRGLYAGRLFPMTVMEEPSGEIDGRKLMARTRRLSLRLCPESRTEVDRCVALGIDLGAETTAALAQELAAEINQEHLMTLRAFASIGPTVTDETNPHESVVATAKAMRPRGNWAVINPTVLTKMQQFGCDMEAARRHADGIGAYYRLDGIDYYVDMYASDNTATLVGHDGREVTRVWYHPYVLASSNGCLIDPSTFEPVIPFLTRYCFYIDAKSDVRAEEVMGKQFVRLPTDYLTFRHWW